jgi:hypothetical protein
LGVGGRRSQENEGVGGRDERLRQPRNIYVRESALAVVLPEDLE